MSKASRAEAPVPGGQRFAVDESGSSAVEFVLVGLLLTALTLAVLQLGLAVYVRNMLHDAAAEGAHYAALADTGLSEGEERTRLAISRSVGEAYASDISVFRDERAGIPIVTVQVRATFPVIGLLGIPAALEVEADAPVEVLFSE